jgi:hypothetical protein
MRRQRACPLQDNALTARRRRDVSAIRGRVGDGRVEQLLAPFHFALLAEGNVLARVQGGLVAVWVVSLLPASGISTMLLVSGAC